MAKTCCLGTTNNHILTTETDNMTLLSYQYEPCGSIAVVKNEIRQAVVEKSQYWSQFSLLFE
jgi:hypothetical protein